MAQDDFYRGDAGHPPPPGYGPPPGYPAPPGPGYGWGPPPGYPVWRRPTNPMAVAALVTGFMMPPVGIGLGIAARRRIRQTGEDGDGLALAGIIVGSIATGFWVLLILLWLALFASITSGSFGP